MYTYPALQIEEKRIVIDSGWFSADREIKRSKGLHLSHVINFIDNKKYDDTGDRSDSLNNYAVSGFLWERVIDRVVNLSKEELFEWLFTQALFDVPNPKLIRPGEQSIDICDCPECKGKGCDKCRGTGRINLYFTPDAYSVDEAIMEEHKWTTKSSRNDISKFDRWINYQIPMYLKVLGLFKCRLRVLFSRGNYTTGEPEWKEFMLTYSQQELDEIFDMVMLNAKYMVDNGLVNF